MLCRAYKSSLQCYAGAYKSSPQCYAGAYKPSLQCYAGLINPHCNVMQGLINPHCNVVQGFINPHCNVMQDLINPCRSEWRNDQISGYGYKLKIFNKFVYGVRVQISASEGISPLLLKYQLGYAQRLLVLSLLVYLKLKTKTEDCNIVQSSSWIITGRAGTSPRLSVVLNVMTIVSSQF